VSTAGKTVSHKVPYTAVGRTREPLHTPTMDNDLVESVYISLVRPLQIDMHSRFRNLDVSLREARTLRTLSSTVLSSEQTSA
jgi:hypothetical protein